MSKQTTLYFKNDWQKIHTYWHCVENDKLLLTIDIEKLPKQSFNAFSQLIAQDRLNCSVFISRTQHSNINRNIVQVAVLTNGFRNEPHDRVDAAVVSTEKMYSLLQKKYSTLWYLGGPIRNECTLTSTQAIIDDRWGGLPAQMNVKDTNEIDKKIWHKFLFFVLYFMCLIKKNFIVSLLEKQK